MAKVIEMPKLSDTMEEGGIANWLKKEGDRVEEGEPLVEIETDKATQEYESPEEGILLKIVVLPGKSAVLGAPIAVIGEKGENVDLAQLLKGSAAPAPAKDAAAPAQPEAAAVEVKAPTAAKPESAPAANKAKADGRLKSSPLARKAAKDHNLDLGHVSGSGPGGRIVLRDVEAALKAGGAPRAEQQALPVMGGGADQTLPVSMMRKTIAKRLVAGKNEAPHFYLTVSADMARILGWRQRLNDEASQSAGRLPKVSVNDLVLLACAKALKLHPMVNASWQGDSILLHGSAHIAMAVALPEGLVTPVVRNADLIGVRAIAQQSRDLAQKAKDGKLGNQDYTGGTFTVSNLGMFGIEEFTAIINPPQAAILAVGATQAVPWVDAAGQLVVQQRMKMTLSCDHRVIDGATGAQFLKTLVSFLEDPLLMMA